MTSVLASVLRGWCDIKCQTRRCHCVFLITFLLFIIVFEYLHYCLKVSCKYGRSVSS
jgi:hypothetical protein